MAPRKQQSIKDDPEKATEKSEQMAEPDENEENVDGPDVVTIDDESEEPPEKKRKTRWDKNENSVKTLTLEGFDVDKVVEIMNKYTKDQKKPIMIETPNGNPDKRKLDANGRILMQGKTPSQGPFANEKMFWKLARPKYGTFNYKCETCRAENFGMQNRFSVMRNGSGWRLLMTESFCENCAKLNFDITDLLLKQVDPFKKKRPFY